MSFKDLFDRLVKTITFFVYRILSKKMREVRIGDGVVIVDVDSTIKFYRTQNDVLSDCNCTDCQFYCDVVSDMNFEIFQILKKMGVSLTKNLETEPTGVACVLDATNGFLFCSNAYRVIGKIPQADSDRIDYFKFENGYRVEATFYHPTENVIDIYLDINKVT